MDLQSFVREDLFQGCTMLYLHGFASSGQNGTVRSLRTLLPRCRVLAPDLPHSPAECMPMLEDLCAREAPDIIVGTSMGGLYALLLGGYDRLVVNPALHLDETIPKHFGLGRQTYHSPRLDGAESFLVTKGLVEEFAQLGRRCFAQAGGSVPHPHWRGEAAYGDDRDHVWGLFGIHDPFVDNYDEFADHYPRAIRFDAEHYLNDKALVHGAMPVLQRIDDARTGRTRRSVMVAFEDVLCDVERSRARGLDGLDMEPVNAASKGIAALSRTYDVYCLAGVPQRSGTAADLPRLWCGKWIGVPLWDRVVLSGRKDLVLGDYLLDAHPDWGRGEDFMGTTLEFGKDPLRDWNDVLEYFSRLGGQ